ncbi:Ethanolamine kinase 2 [Astathelohania contejeani]|uniref:ethanolamine kinase n=1 Tax=Astathelohania contejeani TaxID=164912 RepID=A0ABQ7I292_9MICR|nr:Ethanolamine kinase 2 [Thelohania contejeani]
MSESDYELLALTELENAFGHKNWNIKKLVDGRTNSTFLCCDSKNHLILRIYGADTELLIDREEEIRHLKMLNKNNLAPKLRARFKNGIMVDYIEGTTLTLQQCIDERQKIACLLQKWHGIKKNEQPILWNRMWQWYEIASRKYSEILKHLSVSYFIKELEKIVCSTERSTAFCHNDLVFGNIIKNDDNHIIFIDYEYSGVNYTSFDIANHFCEYAGENNEFSKIPNEEYMREWLVEYANNPSEIEKVISEIKIFIPIAHLFWGLWGLCRVEEIDSYDYGIRRIMEGIIQSSYFLFNKKSIHNGEIVK